ncbi:MAG: glycosyltransferase family 2 protein [Ignavibacteriae bacterium]|nr:glycosyltransferase family 2 protein [Ignavibacteriota bacterium]
MNQSENSQLVTVNILSYNRKDQLKITLTKVYEQDYKNIEVIVVDNASSDGTQEMVKQEFPNVILIELNENIGIAGWNKGFEIAKGEYVLVLDDDAYPEKTALGNCVQKIKENSLIGGITLNIIDLNDNNDNFRTSWLPNHHISECYWPIFLGCAFFLKNGLLGKSPMPKDYFIFQHELPVAADIYNLGFKIYYNKNYLSYHFFKDQTNYNIVADQYGFRNNFKFIIKYLPRTIIIFYLTQIILFYSTRSIRKMWFRKFLEIVFSEKILITNSNRISYKYFWQLRKYHFFNQTLFSKIIK